MFNSTSRKVSPALWMPTLYTAEGLPFVIVNTVSVLMYKDFSLMLKSKGLPGIPDSQIALFTTLAAWPWMLKPLWAPFLEMFKTKKYFVVITELLGGVGLGLLALVLALPDFFVVSLILFSVIAFNFATHDIAADGVYVTTLSEKEQSQYVGWQGAFYNVGKVLSEGVFVMLAGYLEVRIGVKGGWMVVMMLFGAFMVLTSLYHAKMLPTGGASTRVTTIRATSERFGNVVKDFFRKKYIWWGIIFLVLYQFASGQGIKIFPLFLRAPRKRGGLGLPLEEIGVIYGFFPPMAFILGSILAGYYTARRGLKKSLLILCVFFNVPFAAYAFLAITQPVNVLVIGIACVVEYFGYGVGFVGMILFIMQQIAPGKYKTAHYAFGGAVLVFGTNLFSMFSGYVSDFLGYKEFFIWVLIATLPSFLISWFVPFKEIGTESTQTHGEIRTAEK